MLPRLALLFLLAPASGAFAVVSTSHPPSDTAASALVESSGGAFRFATEVLQRDKDEDGKLEIRPRPVRAPGDTAVSRELEKLKNGTAVPFTLTFDGVSRVTLTVTPRDRARSVTNLPVFAVSSDLNELFVRTEARLRGARVTASNLVLNGAAISDSSTAVDNGSGAVDILRIRGGGLAAGFTLTGSLTMSWSHREHGGHEEERTKLDMQIWGAKVVEADTTPPVVTITAPANGSFVTTARPTLSASYSDLGSGIDPTTVRLLVDATNRSADAQVSASGLTFTPSAPLAEGPHAVELFVRDRAVNEGRAALTFTTDTVRPSVAVTAPADSIILRDTTPALGVSYSDATAGVDLSTLEIKLDGAGVPGCVVEASSAACEPSPLSAGSHTLEVAARDRAGHSAFASKTFELVLDLEPPAIVLETPTEGSFVNTSQVLVAGTVTDDGEVVSVQVGDVEATMNGSHFQAVVPLVEGINPLVVNATDATGKGGYISTMVVRDSVPPRLTVKSPQQGQLTNQGDIHVLGQLLEDSGTGALTIQGQPVPVAENWFETRVPVAAGPNLLSLRAVDAAGNETAVDLSVTRFDLPDISIDSPADLSFLARTTVDVGGTVSDPGARVSVNGVAAVVSGATFLARDVPLIEGGNILTATAMSTTGSMATVSLNVVRDLTAPRLAIHYPEAGATLSEPAVDVSGLVNDIVAGTVNASEARVTVNGQPATVANRSFLVRGVPLSSGDNLLQVEAVDASGNRGEASLVVHLAAPAGARIVVASGDHQAAPIGTRLPEPMVVSVLDAFGQPEIGKPVLFKVRENNGRFEGGKRRLVVTTDATGRASCPFTLGTRAGAGAPVVEASSPGLPGSVVFFAFVLPGVAAQLVVDSGDQQVGIAGRQLPRPLVAVVTDAGHNRLEGVAVRLQVVKGEGRFANGLGEALEFSDSDGRAIVPWTLDPEDGVANNVVEARIEGLDPSPLASFVASGRGAGDPAATSISGVVLDNQNQPLPGVTLRILDTSLTTQSDEGGLFKIQGAPVGSVKLIVDGSTTERPGSWPTLEFVLTTIPGRDNTVNMPIYLLPLDLRTGLTVDETHGGTLTLPEIPGFALEISPGSVTFPSGSRSGVISVTVVHNDKVPMVPNFGQQPRFIVTIQPAGARFEPPARLTLPNLEGLAPGEVTEMYSFDHDLGHFVSIGPATVSNDGSLIVANRGVGVIKAGWHCGGNPTVSGTPHACPRPCMICSESQCVPGCTLTSSASASATNSGLASIFAAACGCSDNNACTINDRCGGPKGCQGDPVKATSVKGFCVAPPDTPVTFTAEGNAPALLGWNTNSPGTPATGGGEQFTTRWRELGPKAVAAGCGSNASKKKDVMVEPKCSTGVAKPQLIGKTPAIPSGKKGFFKTEGISFLEAACTDRPADRYCLMLADYHTEAGFAVISPGPEDVIIKTANDSVINAENCLAVLEDITPTGLGEAGRAPNRKYWSPTIITLHEQQHLKEWMDTVVNPTFFELRAWLATKCQECFTPLPTADVTAEYLRIVGPKYASYDALGEDPAFAIERQEYLALAQAIRARARQEGWREDCR